MKADRYGSSLTLLLGRLLPDACWELWWEGLPEIFEPAAILRDACAEQGMCLHTVGTRMDGDSTYKMARPTTTHGRAVGSWSSAPKEAGIWKGARESVQTRGMYRGETERAEKDNYSHESGTLPDRRPPLRPPPKRRRAVQVYPAFAMNWSASLVHAERCDRVAERAGRAEGGTERRPRPQGCGRCCCRPKRWTIEISCERARMKSEREGKLEGRGRPGG